ncbi:MAG: hypothetical protein HY776_05340 [Actinobacteria bacterium]|nr:hypothetical protein [Actinomycetota bacterium]
MSMIFENWSFKSIKPWMLLFVLLLSIFVFIIIGYFSSNNPIISVLLGIDLAVVYYYISFGFLKKSSAFAQNAMVGGFFMRLTLFVAFIFLLRKLAIFNIFILLISFVAVHAFTLPVVVFRTSRKLTQT